MNMEPALKYQLEVPVEEADRVKVNSVQWY